MNHWSKNHSLQEQASEVVRKHMVITGLVQGVGFRYFTVIQARQLGVSGWVRNRYDGSVEVEAQGSQESVQALVKQLKLGPRWSDNLTIRVNMGVPRRLDSVRCYDGTL